MISNICFNIFKVRYLHYPRMANGDIKYLLRLYECFQSVIIIAEFSKYNNLKLIAFNLGGCWKRIVQSFS